jgi:hypothetical protein
LLSEKKISYRNAADKLKGGLNKLVETREQVAKMQVVCQDKQVVVAQAKKECEEVLVQIVTEKRIVDDQEMKVISYLAVLHSNLILCTRNCSLSHLREVLDTRNTLSPEALARGKNISCNSTLD